ncbi:MAG: tRNA (adenosine(37)-N6)-threonylcarbamoyltransferase complex ATPase subunit type 1 TsaE [Fidelibacterota bacterium]|nr:MAG: tRNA (adenosine(37)-N6)-threonylcarbamoyltransferase complex ATPase subunit type 1 TsaE [Candidatus Neomarinimicrobiota bacterium]
MPPTNRIEWTGTTTDCADETRRAGGEFVRHLSPGSVVALHGNLGTGKTTFIQGMAEGLGLGDQVSSPTFALIHEYGQPPGLYHLDCYRETSLARWRMLGLEEYFYSSAITAIEWAENIAPLLPDSTLHLTFSYGPQRDERIIELQP